jgi:hypothetical protein
MLDPPLSPPSTPAEFFGACVWEGGGQEFLPKFLINFFLISGNSKYFFQQQQKNASQGTRWVPKIFSYPKFFFCDLKLIKKFQNPGTTPSGHFLFFSKKT